MDQKSQDFLDFTSADQLLDAAAGQLSSVSRVLDKYGDVSISGYLSSLTATNIAPSQQRDDLFNVVYRYVRPLLGKSIAHRVVEDIAESSLVLTTNHHGFNYFSQDIQASLLFALDRLSGRSSATTVPIFSCGNIPLNNLTYPRGTIIYRLSGPCLDSMPLKLPVFPDRLKHSLVNVVPAYHRERIFTAERRLKRMAGNGEIPAKIAITLQEILLKDYCHENILELPDYVQQSIVLSNRIWKRLFTEVPILPEMVCLDIENIARLLLEQDLSEPDSPACSIMFDSALRNNVLDHLDGAKGCWNRKKLSALLQPGISTQDRKNAERGCGTTFFWGVDNSGRGVPLSLEMADSIRPELTGIDISGNQWSFPFSARAIIKELREKRLLPSLFTSYFEASFVRGIACPGGYFQGEYLPSIQKGLILALHRTGGYNDFAHLIGQVQTDFYLSGMLTVMTETDEAGYLIPAGPVEIIAGGGITNDDIEQMHSLTVREAHLASLFETAPDAFSRKLFLPGWKKQLAADCFRLLKGRIVVK